MGSIATRLIFLGGVTSLVVLLNTSGNDVYRVGLTAYPVGERFHVFTVYCEYGWPWTYLWQERNAVRPPLHQRMSSWPFMNGISRYSVTALIFDAFIGVIIVLASNWAFARWQRRRNGVCRCRLIDFLATMCIVAVMAWTIGTSMRANRTEAAAVHGLRNIVSKKTPEHQAMIGAEGRCVWKPGGPVWLRQLLGKTFFCVFDRVVAIEVASEDIEHVSDFRQLRVVRLGGPLTPSQLSVLAELPHLEALDLSSTDLSLTVYFDAATGEAVPRPEVSLPDLPKLRGLVLFWCPAPINIVGWERLQSLELLQLSGSGIDNETLASVSELSRLKILGLAHTSASSQGFCHLSALRHLEELSLVHSSINDSALEHLTGLRQLRVLSLSHTRVSDASIPVLRQFAKLESLSLVDTRVTSNGIAELQQALPNCRIGF